MPPAGGQGPRKIASIGVHVSRWVTTHGYALNVDLDPAPFTEWITACGLEDAAFTTMARELERSITVEEVRPAAIAALAEVFGLELEELPADEGAGLWSQPIHASLAADDGDADDLGQASACRLPRPHWARDLRPPIRPARVACAAAAARDDCVSLRRMFATWRCTVCSLRTSDEAISRFESPAATSLSTSVSRLLSGESPFARRERRRRGTRRARAAARADRPPTADGSRRSA